MNFVIKSLAPIVAGGGLGTGGVYAYRSVIPTTWQEYLEREGFQILDTESENKDFKAIFVEHESLITSSSDSTLKEAKDISNHDKIKTYCSTKLKENTNWDEKTKSELIKLCTYSGITTVKAKITEAKKGDSSNLSWIKNSEDEKYKTLFAIYKYSEKFRNWLNEGNSEGDNIKDSDKADEKFQKLKDKCESESKKKHSENKGNKDVYNKVYWWCIALDYDTVEKRIKKVDAGWEQETDGNTIKTRWEHTDSVKSTIKTDQSSSSSEPSDSDYSGWCTTQLQKKLYEEGIYRDKYLKIRFVCKKQQTGTK